MKRFLPFIIIAIIFTANAGCSKKVVTSETAVGQIPQEAVKPNEEAAKAEAVKEKETAAVTAPVEVPSITAEAMKSQETAAVTAPVEVLKLRDIFFDFDRFTIRGEARSILEANTEYLKANKDSKILIQGHCDERGTSEYNMALGERRAQSAKKYLIDMGIDPSRISTVSYGREKPFCTDHNEECWQENRRAYFAIK